MMICRVEIKDNMTIPPMTSTMMPVEIPGVNHLTEYGLIEGTTGTAKSTLTIPGIINTQDQVHFVNVVNYGDDEVKLYKKETIGTCESYTEHDLKPEQIRTLQKDCFTASEEIPEHLTDLLKRSSTYINEDQRQQLSRLLSQRPCKSCERQESGNHASDDETDEIQLEETDFVNQELHENEEPTPRIEIVRVCTRSQTGNQYSATPSGYCIDGWDPDSIRQCQLEDLDMSLIVTYLQEKKNKPDWDQVSKGTSFQKTIWRQWDRLTINNGMLYRKFYCSDKDDVDNFKLQLLVPKSHQKTVFKYFHDVPSAGHLGPDKMLSRIQQLFYWPAMKSSITRYCKECDQCAARKSTEAEQGSIGSILGWRAYGTCGD
ncbi:unnamed protein product [Mytilus edulis]|uniref:Integrase zinc-binding domain-containing protein n=1 Tax=Mytilus edulis TaxID=6550 RepID=A0A8S3Q9L9_MYTED|nr:unnamed protein product [Mytilus edulis]